MTEDAELILLAGVVLTAAIAVALLASRVRLPALVAFVGLGMAVGSEGLGWIAFDDYRLARLIGTVALAAILFEGGLTSGWREIRPALRPALLLAVIGTVLTALIAGLAATWLFGLTLTEGLLLGAILSATDGAAVFALLRGARLPARLRQTLQGEAGFNDPVAILLVLVAVELVLTPGYGVGDAMLFLVRQVALGVGVGLLVGRGSVALLGRFGGHLPPGLGLAASLAAPAIAFGTAGALGGSGFLAVYLVGLAFGDAPLPERASVRSFHEGLATLAEIGMFFALGLLVYPSELGQIADKGVMLGLVIAFVARPLATLAATWRQRFTGAERIVLGWAGLRGAVPVVLATLPIIRGVPDSLLFFNVVFFAVLVSAALQGLTVRTVAGRLGVAAA